MGYMKPTVVTPSGRCPVLLAATDDQAILVWAKRVREARDDVSLTNDALKYYTQHSFDIFSPEWEHVRSRIDEIVKDVKRPKPAD